MLSTLSGCATLGTNAAREHALVETFSGTYQGSFGSALTEDPADDLNYIPCDSSRQRCLSTDAYLADILLDLSQDADGAVRLRFFRSLSDQRRGVELDLLGRGDGARSQSKVKPFVRSLRIKFPILIDNNNEVMRKLQVQVLPTTILIAPNGMVVARQVGYSPDGIKKLEERIVTLLTEYANH